MTTPSLLVGFTNISATTPVVTTEAIETVGANRRLCVKPAMRNGGGTAKQPTSLNIGGVAATYYAGENTATATDRVCNGTWGLNEAGIAAMTLNVAGTGYDVTMTGQSGSIRTVIMYIVQDTDQTAIGDTEHIFTSSGGTLSLVRAFESFTVFSAYISTLTTLTLAEPSWDTAFADSSNGTRLNIGYEADTARTADATFNNGSGFKSAHIINFLPVPNQTITSVNGGTNVVQYGTAFTWAHSGFPTAPNAATLAGIACSSVTTNGGAAPALIDESAVPTPGARTLSGSNGTVSANFAVTLQAPAGFQAVQLAGTLNTTNTGCIHNMSPAVAEGHWIIAPTANNTIIYPNGDFETDSEETMQFWHIQTASPASETGTARSYNFTAGAGVSTITRSHSIGLGIGIGV